ncbi:Period circadian protein [Penicillium argentinense]|uniref:Period circadian protein n=1 Tax=Penicillium argentinense TaxID=1131581 RepID=A0A9W9K6T5_9EURO|nr:Period circadian protein [Penicillium argentinense]KAJ5095293.1 Period circadian protein [Penicillium argentinense]
MFFKKSTLALAFVALASFVSADQTPACLLSVIGDTANPADLATLCGDDSKKVQSNISDKCGDKADKALKFYANTCKENGHTVELSTSSSNTTSSSSSATATSGSQTTSTGSSSSGDSSSGSSTSSAPQTTYTDAAPLNYQFSVTAIGAAVFVGAAALL